MTITPTKVPAGGDITDLMRHRFSTQARALKLPVVMENHLRARAREEGTSISELTRRLMLSGAQQEAWDLLALPTTSR